MSKKLALIISFWVLTFPVFAESDLSPALELEMKLSVVSKDGQSMQKLSYSNIELFRNAKVGVTHIHSGKDFILIHVSPSDESTPDSPVYDVNLTFIDKVYNGKNELSGHFTTDTTTNLLVPITKDSDVITYNIKQVKIGSMSKRKFSENGSDTGLFLQLK
jgi:hypothetical protein